jgi:hypothetical protein
MSVEFRILVQDVSPLVVQASNRQITAAVGGWGSSRVRGGIRGQVVLYGGPSEFVFALGHQWTSH